MKRYRYVVTLLSRTFTRAVAFASLISFFLTIAGGWYSWAHPECLDTMNFLLWAIPGVVFVGTIGFWMLVEAHGMHTEVEQERDQFKSLAMSATGKRDAEAIRRQLNELAVNCLGIKEPAEATTIREKVVAYLNKIGEQYEAVKFTEDSRCVEDPRLPDPVRRRSLYAKKLADRLHSLAKRYYGLPATSPATPDPTTKAAQ